MSSKLPFIRQASLISLVPQTIVLILFVFITSFLNLDIIFHVLISIVLFYIFALLLRKIAWYHRKGIKLMKTKNFIKAIPMFQKSYEFFSRRSWIDKYRFIFLLSSSHISYREMALINIAFCNTQINQGREAKKYYELALEEFPGSEMAQTALNMMEASKNVS
jgi:tetratricopeptide (TPR) repeat protein